MTDQFDDPMVLDTPQGSPSSSRPATPPTVAANTLAPSFDIVVRGLDPLTYPFSPTESDWATLDAMNVAIAKRMDLTPQVKYHLYRFAGDGKWAMLTSTRRMTLTANPEETPYILVPMNLCYTGKVATQLFHFQMLVNDIWIQQQTTPGITAEALASGFRKLVLADRSLNFASGPSPTIDQLRAAFGNENIAQSFFDALQRREKQVLDTLERREKELEEKFSKIITFLTHGLVHTYMMHIMDRNAICENYVGKFGDCFEKSKISKRDGDRVSNKIELFANRLLNLDLDGGLPNVESGQAEEETDAIAGQMSTADDLNAYLKQLLAELCDGKQNDTRFTHLDRAINGGGFALAKKHFADVDHRAVAEDVKHVLGRSDGKNELTLARYALNPLLKNVAAKAIRDSGLVGQLQLEFDSNWNSPIPIFERETGELRFPTLKPAAFITANLPSRQESLLVSVVEEKVVKSEFDENKNKGVVLAWKIWKELQLSDRTRLPGPIPFATIHANELEIYFLFHSYDGMDFHESLAFEFQTPQAAALCDNLAFLRNPGDFDFTNDDRLRSMEFGYKRVGTFNLQEEGGCANAIRALYNIFRYSIALFENLPEKAVYYFPNKMNPSSLKKSGTSKRTDSVGGTSLGTPGNSTEGSEQNSNTGGSGTRTPTNLKQAYVQSMLQSTPQPVKNGIDVSKLEFTDQRLRRTVVARTTAGDLDVNCKFGWKRDERMTREQRVLREIANALCNRPRSGIQRLLPLNVACGDSLQVLVTEYAGEASFVAETTDQFVEYARQLLTAVQTLHNAGWVHSDISPANVCVKLDANGGLVVTLIDYEFAKQLDPDSECGETRHAYHYNGTRDYVAPELDALKNDDDATIKYTTKMDVYSVGRVLKYACQNGVGRIMNGFMERLTADDSPQRPTAGEALDQLLNRNSATGPTPPQSCPDSTVPL